MMGGTSLGAVKRSESGAVLVEFALLLIPMSILLLGAIEIGYRMYGQAVLVGTLREAARMASTGLYVNDGNKIDDYVKGRLRVVGGKTATVAIIKKSYASFTNVGLPEPFTVDKLTAGKLDPDDCYLDVNNNNQWDADQGTTGLGGPDDVIYYEATLTYRTIFPFVINRLGMSPNVVLTANTIVSNEPFRAATTTITPERCV